MRSPLTHILLSLLLLLFQPLTAQSPQDANKEYKAAASGLKSALRTQKTSRRLGAIQRLRRTKDPRAVKDLRTAIHKIRKKEAAAEKKLAPLLRKRKDLAARIDERFGGKQTVAMGSVKNLLDKKEELDEKITPLENIREMELRTLSALFIGLGEVIGDLPEAEATVATSEIVRLFDRVRKDDDRLVYISILSNVRTPGAVAALSNIVLNDSSPAMRVAGLDALATLGDSRGRDAVVDALSDDFWPVRAAAVAAMAEIGSLKGVPALIERMAEEDGRLKGDIQTALESMAGVTFFDNIPLWKKWWSKKQSQLETILADIDGDSAVKRATAMEDAREEGFLLAARHLLDNAGYSLNAVLTQEAHRIVDPEKSRAAPVGGKNAGGEDAEAQEEESVFEVAGSIIGTRPKKIRDRAYKRLLARPLSRSLDPRVQRGLWRTMGYTQTKAAAGTLAALMNTHDTDKDTEVLIDALGNTEHADAVRPLLSQFISEDTSIKLLLSAVSALEKIGSAESTRGLISALGEMESRGDAEVKRLLGVAHAIEASLRRLTAVSEGPGHAKWIDWWGGQRGEFKTVKEQEIAAAIAAGDRASDEKSGTEFYGIKTYSKRIAYILDVSGSMLSPSEYAGGGTTKIDVAKKELLRSLASLPKDATFNIIFYSTDFRIWQKKMLEASAKNKKAARRWIEKVTANGATNIFDPLAKAFEIAGRGTFDKEYGTALDTIFFLSDGQPNQGKIIRPSHIIREIGRINSLKKVQIHTVGIGRGHDRGFMKRLAEMTGGTYVTP